MPVPESILYLTESDVRQTMTIAEAVDLAEKGIQADAAGQVVGDKFYMNMGESGFVKPFSGYLLGEELAFVKTFLPEVYRRARVLGLGKVLDISVKHEA